MKKILLYSWDELVANKNRGGGVTVYLKNLITEMLAEKVWDVYYLSSGRIYNADNDNIYTEECDNCISDKCHSFHVVNSPFLAPASLAFNDFKTYVEDKELRVVVKKFIDNYGPFDVIHYHNLEGLSLSVLDLKKDYPDTKFVYTLHNYFPLCPQVNLWKKNIINCDGDNACCECVECMPINGNVKKIKKKLAYSGDSEKLAEIERSYSGEIIEVNKDELIEVFRKFKKENIKYINNYMDTILAVSEKTGRIAIDRGIDSSKVKTLYIGTKVAESQKGYSCNKDTSLPLNILYIGYMRKEKGFYFFLDALEKIPETFAKKLKVSVIAKKTDMIAVDRFEKIKNKFSDIEIIDGYIHDELPDLLSDKHLGIVPVLWEDNLPQIAIEMVAYGVPILCADLGGTQELCTDDRFVFKAGDIEALISRLEDFVVNPKLLEEYWKNNKRLVTMNEHLKMLNEIYE